MLTIDQLPDHVQKNSAKIAAEIAKRKNARYTPPVCRSTRCVCATQWGHIPEPPKPGRNMDATLRWLGMSRHKDGSMWLRPHAAQTGTVKRMRENIAACAAVGLSFWAEAGGTGVWAVSPNGGGLYHLVSVDRKASTARVVCGSSFRGPQSHYCEHQGAAGAYTTPDDTDATLALLIR